MAWQRQLCIISIRLFASMYFSPVHASYISLISESAQPLKVYVPHFKLPCSERAEKYRHSIEKIYVFKILSTWMKDIAMYTQDPWTEILPGDRKRYFFSAQIPQKIESACVVRLVKGDLFSGISIDCGGKYCCAIGTGDDVRWYVHDAGVSLVDALNTETLMKVHELDKDTNAVWSSSSRIMCSDVSGWDAYLSYRILGRIRIKKCA
jgi:hypothetical protein